MSDLPYYVRAKGKITGPFDLTTVRKLARRGTISRLDELSRDRVTWEPAVATDSLFPTIAAATAESPPAPEQPRQVAANEEIDRFYYQQNGTAMGPVPVAVLQSLVSSGQVGRDDPVWAEGATSSTIALAMPQLQGLFPVVSSTRRRPPPRPVLVPLAKAVVSSSVAIYLGYLLWKSRHPETPPVDVPAHVASASVSPANIQSAAVVMTNDGRPLIKSVNDEAQLSQAVGFVVCGVHLITPEGKTIEIAESSGSCFAVSPDGYMLTNQHVVAETAQWIDAKAKRESILKEKLIVVEPKVWVFLSGTKYTAQIIFVSGHFDLAILRISRKGELQPSFRLSPAGHTLRTADVFAIGFPGVGSKPLSIDDVMADYKISHEYAADVTETFKKRDFEFTLTKGVVSRTIQETGGQTYVQHEAVIRHGNSGGPLVTAEGVVIAINTRLQSDKDNVQMNMALEISQLRKEIDEHVPNALWQE